jgi:hypothetical protein
MPLNPVNPAEIKVGATVVSINGETLGQVREVYPHFIIVSRSGEHQDLDVPVHSILSVAGGRVQTSVTRDSSNRVDDVETAHRMIEEEQR